MERADSDGQKDEDMLMIMDLMCVEATEDQVNINDCKEANLEETLNEIDGLANKGVWEIAPRSQRTARTGRGPNKGPLGRRQQGRRQEQGLQIEVRGDGDSEDARRKCQRDFSRRCLLSRRSHW